MASITSINSSFPNRTTLNVDIHWNSHDIIANVMFKNGSFGPLSSSTSITDLVSEYNRSLFTQRRMLLQTIQKNVEDLKSTLPEISDEFNTSDVDWLVESAYVNSLDEDAEIKERAAIAYDRLISEIEAESKGLQLPDKVVTVASLVESARQNNWPSAHQPREALLQLLAREAASRSKKEEVGTSRGSSPGGRAMRNTCRGRPSRGSLTAAGSSHRRPSIRGEEVEKKKKKTTKTSSLAHPGAQKHWSSQKMKQLNWPSAEFGFFCLLRGFLTQTGGGERRRLTTAQLCEYVREWQAQNARLLLRSPNGRNLFSWISRSEDWSAVTPHVLQFLTGEPVPLPSPGIGGSGTSSRHSSRRLTCPRPFVNSRPRVHQWSWLLAVPTSSSVGCGSKEDSSDRFSVETMELERLFADWVRAPRGLGGLADAEWMVSSAQSEQQQQRRPGRRSCVGPEPGSSAEGSDSELTDGDDQDGVARPLRIVEEPGAHDEEKGAQPTTARVSGRKKAGREPKGRKSGKQARIDSSVDTSVPPPLYPTTARVRPFTEEEKYSFQLQEHERFTHPWAPFVYRLPEHVAVVGPLRAAPGAKDPRREEVVAPASCANAAASLSGYRARDHPMLRGDRPLLASLAEIVRDAVACLPNGEGSRADITALVKHSGFLLLNANARQLQQCVSSALDRLQGEAPDPSVYFNASRRLWVYRHRHRTPEEFAELHERRREMLEAKKQVQRGDSQTTTMAGTTTASKRRVSTTPRCRGRQSKFSQYPRYPAESNLASVSFVNRGELDEEDLEDLEHPEEVAMGDADYSYIPDIEELEAADLLRASSSGVVPGDFDDEEEDEDVDVYEDGGHGEHRVLTRYHRADSHLRATQGFHNLSEASESGEDLEDVELPAIPTTVGRRMPVRFGNQHKQGPVLAGRSGLVCRRRERDGGQVPGYVLDVYETSERQKLRFVDNDDLDISSFVGFPHPQASLSRDFGNYPYSNAGPHF